MRDIRKNKYIYLILLPGLLYYGIFCYAPMYGIQLAFKDFRAIEGIWGSPFVGLKHYAYIFKDQEFWQAFRNTIEISFSRLLFQFPVPIVLALLLNELREGRYKKWLQTLFTFPNFLSWVIVSGMIVNVFGTEGAVNHLLTLFGGNEQMFLANQELFRPLLYLSDIWKSSGWVAIIYLATIASISPDLYEASYMDGANRFQRMLYITWPGIRSAVVLMLLLSVGNTMNAGFDQIFNMYNPAVLPVSDILDTYIYRVTFQTSGDFGFSTAVGLFKSLINFALLVLFDRLAKAVGERGIF
ncbi:ABC transporter permease [Cohnella rhizosphaerae]|uniref:ABC transporter permease subunit n=1 Tax=Cohnella rhizosphaerae TaxID=1457232 RepID=A0A9X4KZS6_9BACL|nr:ABC transporter permease subunit [Cohnella rhizosphaerae]MDG0813563.1 ABC transporter permease subunit [Cohnella rhizosphaerae]